MNDWMDSWQSGWMLGREEPRVSIAWSKLFKDGG